MNKALRDLRINMMLKNVTYDQFIHKLDSDENGFITIDEFQKGVKEIMDLSKQVIDGIYAYIDKLNIGLVHRNQVFEFIKLKNEKQTYETFILNIDNWEKELKVIKMIKEWA